MSCLLTTFKTFILDIFSEVKKKKNSSPEIIRVLQQNSSDLQKIKSPKSISTQLDLTGSPSVSFTINREFQVFYLLLYCLIFRITGCSIKFNLFILFTGR